MSEVILMWIFSISFVSVFPCVEQRDAVVVLVVQRCLVARGGAGSAARCRSARRRCRHRQGHGRGKHHLLSKVNYRVNLVIERRDCHSEEVLDHCRFAPYAEMLWLRDRRVAIKSREISRDLLEVSLPETELFLSFLLRSFRWRRKLKTFAEST